MIPKIIHYCWFGKSDKPSLFHKCLKSWKKFFPDYEIKEWNEDNFDINMIPYTKEAYSIRKYAFVSDYARFWILYNYGGIYFDTDVEILRPMDDIIRKGAFMGREISASLSLKRNIYIGINPGIGLGCEKGNRVIGHFVKMYLYQHYIDQNGCINNKTIVDYTSEYFTKAGLENVDYPDIIEGVTIYPKDYFCPMFGKYICFTENTRSTHHYMGSWKNLTFRKRIIALVHLMVLTFYKAKLKLV